MKPSKGETTIVHTVVFETVACGTVPYETVDTETDGAGT